MCNLKKRQLFIYLLRILDKSLTIGPYYIGTKEVSCHGLQIAIDNSALFLF